MLSPTRARLSAMIPANGSPFTRNVPVKMTWFGRMTAGRNNIIERQKAYQAESHVPTYLRGNGKHMYSEFEAERTSESTGGEGVGRRAGADPVSLARLCPRSCSCRLCCAGVWLASYAVSTFVTGQQLYQLLQVSSSFLFPFRLSSSSCLSPSLFLVFSAPFGADPLAHPANHTFTLFLQR